MASCAAERVRAINSRNNYSLEHGEKRFGTALLASACPCMGIRFISRALSFIVLRLQTHALSAYPNNRRERKERGEFVLDSFGLGAGAVENSGLQGGRSPRRPSQEGWGIPGNAPFFHLSRKAGRASKFGRRTPTRRDAQVPKWLKPYLGSGLLRNDESAVGDF